MKIYITKWGTLIPPWDVSENDMIQILIDNGIYILRAGGFLVEDKQKFMLAVLKHSIEYLTITNDPSREN